LKKPFKKKPKTVMPWPVFKYSDPPAADQVSAELESVVELEDVQQFIGIGSHSPAPMEDISPAIDYSGLVAPIGVHQLTDDIHTIQQLTDNPLAR
jgi:hypothetical protein